MTVAGIDRLQARFNASTFAGRIVGGYRFVAPWMNLTPYAAGQVTSFELPGASFVVNGAAQAKDAALTTASAEMKWRNGFSASATFEGEFSNVSRSYAGKGVVRYAW